MSSYDQKLRRLKQRYGLTQWEALAIIDLGDEIVRKLGGFTPTVEELENWDAEPPGTYVTLTMKPKT